MTPLSQKKREHDLFVLLLSFEYVTWSRHVFFFFIVAVREDDKILHSTYYKNTAAFIQGCIPATEP